MITTSTYPRWPGDSEPSFVFELSQRLGNFFEVYVLCPHARGALPYEENGNVKIIRYKYMPFGLESLAYEGGIISKLKKSRMNYLQVIPFLVLQFINLIKITKKYEIDVIHAHWIIPQGFVAACFRTLIGSKIKILGTIHGSDIFGLRGILGRALKKFVLKRIDALSVVSNAIASAVTKYGYGKSSYVYPMGVDTAVFHPEKFDQLLKQNYGIHGAFLLFVGRLVENKGVQFLLTAMPAVLAHFPSTKLVIVGDGIFKEQLLRIAVALGIEKNIIFVGALSHESLPAYFATADVVIAPSIRTASGESEGFGLVCIEAMSSGTPVIVSDLPAFDDVLEEGKTGYKVKQNDPEEISKNIIFLLERKETLEAMSAEARRRAVERFDWNRVSDNYRQLIEGLM